MGALAHPMFSFATRLGQCPSPEMTPAAGGRSSHPREWSPWQLPAPALASIKGSVALSGRPWRRYSGQHIHDARLPGEMRISEPAVVVDAHGLEVARVVDDQLHRSARLLRI